MWLYRRGAATVSRLYRSSPSFRPFCFTVTVSTSLDDRYRSSGLSSSTRFADSISTTAYADHELTSPLQDPFHTETVTVTVDEEQQNSLGDSDNAINDKFDYTSLLSPGVSQNNAESTAYTSESDDQLLGKELSPLETEVQSVVEEILSFFRDINQHKLLSKYSRSLEKQTNWEEKSLGGGTLDTDERVPAYAICLLRTLTRREWAMFNEATGEEAGEDKEEEIDFQPLIDSCIDEESSGSISLHSGSLVDDMLNDVRSGNSLLSTSAYNLLLARVALAPDMMEDEVLSKIMVIYQEQIVKLHEAGVVACAPDDTTYEILLTCLTQRCLASRNATDIINNMISGDPGSVWNPFSLKQAIVFHCSEAKDLDKAMHILKQVTTISERTFRIPVQAFHETVLIAKSENRVDDAIEAITMCLGEHASRCNDRQVDKIFLDVLRWPFRNTEGKSSDTYAALEKILTLLESSPLYRPGFGVWAQACLSCYRGAKWDAAYYSLVERVFNCLATEYPNYWPSEDLLEAGIRTSESLGNSQLAAELAQRVAGKYSSWHDRTPSLAITKSLKRIQTVCLRNRDVESIRSVLASIEKIRDLIPATSYQDLLELGVIAYSCSDNPDYAEALVLAMMECGLIPREESFGAVIQSFAVTGKIDDANNLFQSIESGIYNVEAGPSCYSAAILAHVKAQNWDDVLRVYEVTRSLRVSLSPSSYDGILLASHRRGGKLGALAFLEQMLDDSEFTMSLDGFIRAIQIFTPELEGRPNFPVSEFRINLRETLLDTGIVSNKCVDGLTSSLRIFELESQRQPSASVTDNDIEARRHETSCVLLEQVIEYAHQREKASSPGDLDSTIS